MNLFSTFVQIIIRCISWIARHFGLRGILITIFLIEIPITLNMYSDISEDYKYEEQYCLRTKTDLQLKKPGEVEEYGDTIQVGNGECYLYELEIQNVYDKKMNYPLLHYVMDDSGSGISCTVDHAYQSYYDIPEDDEYRYNYNEVIPAYATLNIPCMVSLDWYDLSAKEQEEFQIKIGPVIDELTQEHTVVLTVPKEEENR